MLFIIDQRIPRNITTAAEKHTIAIPKQSILTNINPMSHNLSGTSKT